MPQTLSHRFVSVRQPKAGPNQPSCPIRQPLGRHRWQGAGQDGRTRREVRQLVSLQGNRFRHRALASPW